MDNKDICIKDGNEKFNFRVAAVLRYNNKILIQKGKKDNFFSLVGGRVRLGEKTIEALIREIKEEINLVVSEEKCKLMRVCENFFEFDSKKFHEILFIYSVEINEQDEIEKEKEFVCFDKPTTKMLWINENDVEELEIRPKETKNIIHDNNLKHLVITK